MKPGQLPSRTLEGMSEGELRAHLAVYLEEQFSSADERDRWYAPLKDPYVLSVALRISRLSDGAVADEEVIEAAVTDAVHGQGRLL